MTQGRTTISQRQNTIEMEWLTLTHGTIAESTSLVEDLRSKLTGRADNKDQGLSTDTLANTKLECGRVRTRSSKLLGLAHQLGQNRNQKRGCLAGAYSEVSNGTTWMEVTSRGNGMNEKKNLPV